MKKFYMLIILAAILFSCAENAPTQIERPPYDGPTPDEVEAQFWLEKAAWERQGITHYRYTMVDHSRMPFHTFPPYTITVYGGNPRLTAVDGTPVSIMDPEWAEGWQIEPRTIDSHFKDIEYDVTYRGEWAGDEIPRIIKYNKQYHYPEYFAGVYSDNTHWAILEITEFEKLQ